MTTSTRAAGELTEKWRRIVETDNHGSDYPNEKFVNLPPMSKEQAKQLADLINRFFCNCDAATRFWKVVPWNYVLQPGFEP